MIAHFGVFGGLIQGCHETKDTFRYKSMQAGLVARLGQKWLGLPGSGQKWPPTAAILLPVGARENVSFTLLACGAFRSILGVHLLHFASMFAVALSMLSTYQ